MRGRHIDAYSMYKRGTKEHGFDAYDKEQGPGILRFTFFFIRLILL